MQQLNLKAIGPEQEAVLNYLQENAGSMLADKINNGVEILKNGATLLNKKTLDSFMDYAREEARKLAENKKYACVKSDTVFAWAIHYFEEESIEGILYNLDGSEYSPKVNAQIKNNIQTPVKSQPKPQISMFDNFEDAQADNGELKDEKDRRVDNTPFNDGAVCEIQSKADEEGEIHSQNELNEIFMELSGEDNAVNPLNIDRETGEVLDDNLLHERSLLKAFDPDALTILSSILGDFLTVR